MKSKFATMTKKELRAYVLANKNDQEAFYILIDRLKEDSRNSPWHPYPKNRESISEMERVIQEKINTEDEDSETLNKG